MDHNCLCLWVRWWWWSTPPPSPSSLCPQINPGTQNSETKRPFWKNAQQSRRGPSRNADRRPPPQPPQWTVCQTIVQLGAKLEDHYHSQFIKAWIIDLQSFLSLIRRYHLSACQQHLSASEGQSFCLAACWFTRGLTELPDPAETSH